MVVLDIYSITGGVNPMIDRNGKPLKLFNLFHSPTYNWEG